MPWVWNTSTGKVVGFDCCGELNANAIYALLTPTISAMRASKTKPGHSWRARPLGLWCCTPRNPDVVRRSVVNGQVRSPHTAAHWQGTVSLGEWTLVTCVLAPPFSGFELADAATDFSQWPDAESAIKRRMR